MDTNEKRNSSAQSLFQIYYLGHTPVDRRCSSAVMPWVIEELKLKAEEMRLIWLSPGECWESRKERVGGYAALVGETVCTVRPLQSA